MKSVQEYAELLSKRSNLRLKNCQIFAKVLSPNDDSGKHGVLVPSEVYDFFPTLDIPDETVNATRHFASFDAICGSHKELAYKYYERYPERRITRVNSIVSDRSKGNRIQVVLRGESEKGEVAYIHDGANEYGDGRFAMLWRLISGDTISPNPGAYVVIPVKYQGLIVDEPLEELLEKFDSIRGKWFDSLRAGDTGIGYTFETLLGIEENNDQTADFRGIELKCKQLKSAGNSGVGKVNLFQKAPVWVNKGEKSIARLKVLGQPDQDGKFSCYSQITTNPNNLMLSLFQEVDAPQIGLQKSGTQVGYWLHKTLEKRLMEKHSRAAFILTNVQKKKTGNKYSYDELIYCEQPTINRFLDLVSQNKLVFEFAMHENERGRVRNHGYPWRLNSEGLLDQLFSVRAKLR